MAFVSHPAGRAAQRNERAEAIVNAALRATLPRFVATDDSILTLDGPAGSGKTTVARAVAQRLGWRFLDTGAMYRAATWIALEAGAAGDPLDATRVVAALRVRPVTLDASGAVRAGGVDLGDRIRTAGVTGRVSAVSALPEVRAILTDEQRAFGARAAPGLVAEGRDMATVVFPHARHRFFLDAAAEVRAERRSRDLLEKRLPVPPLPELIEQIRARDAADSARAVAPMVIGPGVQVIDTSALALDAVVAEILRRIAPRAGDVRA